MCVCVCVVIYMYVRVCTCVCVRAVFTEFECLFVCVCAHTCTRAQHNRQAGRLAGWKAGVLTRTHWCVFVRCQKGEQPGFAAEGLFGQHIAKRVVHDEIQRS